MKNTQIIRQRIARSLRELRIFLSYLDDGSEMDAITRLTGQHGRERIERMLNSWLEELGAHPAKLSTHSDSYRVAQQMIPDFLPTNEVVLVPEGKTSKAKTLTLKAASNEA